MRVLHARAGRLRDRAAGGDAQADERADARGHERQPLPLRRLSGDRACGAAGGRGAGRGWRWPSCRRRQVEMEGRFEERWVLVEEEPPAWEDGARLNVVGHPRQRLTAARAASRARRATSPTSRCRACCTASSCARRTPTRRSSSTSTAARAVPGVLAVLAAGRRRRRRAATRCLTSEPAYAGAPVAALAARRAEAAARGIEALAPRYDGARLRRRPRRRALAEQRFRRIRRERDAATSRPAWRRPT